MIHLIHMISLISISVDDERTESMKEPTSPTLYVDAMTLYMPAGTVITSDAVKPCR